MLVILMGPPGAGKGTQAERIVKEFSVIHLSTGDALRAAIAQGTPMGKLAKEYMNKGLLVPDEVINGIVAERLQQPDVAHGALLDGYPRTVAQAEELDKMLKELGKYIDFVVNLEVDANNLLRRLTGRRICKSCGSSYHLEFNPPKQPGVCDHCGGELIQRPDDESEEKVATRLDEYFTKTKPVLHYYAGKGLLHQVNGEDSIDEVFSSIASVLRGAR
ncbi:MAG: adenylate kinase [Bacilli bacterium]|nr:adenylate kinase [Bacilli bacterium]